MGTPVCSLFGPIVVVSQSKKIVENHFPPVQISIEKPQTCSHKPSTPRYARNVLFDNVFYSFNAPPLETVRFEDLKLTS
jgi:hypothetical protein